MSLKIGETVRLFDPSNPAAPEPVPALVRWISPDGALIHACTIDFATPPPPGQPHPVKTFFNVPAMTSLTVTPPTCFVLV